MKITKVYLVSGVEITVHSTKASVDGGVLTLANDKGMIAQFAAGVWSHWASFAMETRITKG